MQKMALSLKLTGLDFSKKATLDVPRGLIGISDFWTLLKSIAWLENGLMTGPEQTSFLRD